jgi:hypothetical protein
MTGKADFTPEEWETVLEGPTNAGMAVITAERGGSFRESYSMAKAYLEAREHQGESELLDALIAEKPEMEKHHAHSSEELRSALLEGIRSGVALVEAKATPDELEAYRQFALGLARKVAEARKSGFLGLSGERVSDAEEAALAEVADALGIPAAPAV